MGNMGWAECFSTVSCLESWHRWLRLLGLSIALLATILAFLAASIAFLLPAFIESRISFLTAPRHLTDSQKSSLLAHLKRSDPFSVNFYAYVTSPESQTYAGEIKAVFHDAGWKTQGPELFADDGVPPQGIAVVVSENGHALPDEQATFDALQSIEAEHLNYAPEPEHSGLRRLTNSVTVRVGVRPKS